MLENPASPEISRKSLHQELVDRLQQMLIKGELTPGVKVPEKKLCIQFGVSRTPMREALKVLATEGLVRLEPNRGAWVTQVTIGEVNEVFPVLGALEALSGELACKHITDEEIEAVRLLHQQMVENYKARDLEGYFSINQMIHKAILTAARNETLSTSCQALSLRMQRARYLANISEDRWRVALDEHERILRFLSERNGKMLAKTLSDHLETKRASIVKWLQGEHAG